jgi:hypothetical protein
MPRTRRLVVLGIVGATALMLSSSAFAAFTSPRLFASQPEQKNRVHLLYTQSTADDPPAKIVHYVPSSYRTNLEARPAGTLVGTAVLRGNPVDRVGQSPADANLVLSGTVETVTAQTTYKVNGRDVRISTAATNCTGKGLNEMGQYWLIRLKNAGGDVVYDIPAFAERMGTATSFNADATVTVCFRPPDVAANNAERAPFGFRVREFDLRLTRVFTTPARGQQVWSTLTTPYMPRTGRANTAGTVEVQSTLTYPRSVSLNAPVRTGLSAAAATFRFSGSVSVPPLDNPVVSLFRGVNATNAGSARANAFRIKVGAGSFTKTHTIRRVTAAQTFYFQVRAYVQNQIQGRAGCRDNFHPQIQCIQSTRAGYMVRSRTVMVKIPAR